MHFASLIDKPVRLILYELDTLAEIDNSRIKEVLDWEPRSAREMVTSMVESIFEYKVI